MAAAGAKLLLAVSRLGARMSSSCRCRQFRIRAVSMIPAAMVDLPFFLLINSRNSLM